MKKICLKWLKTYRTHLLVWSIFLFYEIVVIGLISKRFGNPVTYLLHYAINIALFYLHARYLQWALGKRSQAILKVPLLVIAEVFLYTIISYWCDVILIHLRIITHVSVLEFNYQLVLTSAYRCLYFIGFSTGYYFIINFIRERQRVAEVEKKGLIKQHQIATELISTQNAFLKAQINPHFLFNALDFVYHSIETDTTKASEAVLLLSRMMRYAVSSNEEDGFILLQHEVEQVENLLYLHQLKHGTNRRIDLEITSGLQGVKFIPLVLLTLTENIIKHGDLRDNQHRAYIRIGTDNGTLSISTSNLAYAKGTTSGTQIGLENIKKRLHRYYGNTFVLEHFTDDHNYFTVKILLAIDYSSEHELQADNATGSGKAPFHASADRR